MYVYTYNDDNHTYIYIHCICVPYWHSLFPLFFSISHSRSLYAFCSFTPWMPVLARTDILGPPVKTLVKTQGKNVFHYDKKLLHWENFNVNDLRRLFI